jgi:uncharacterized double-CXXCG motif protein
LLEARVRLVAALYKLKEAVDPSQDWDHWDLSSSHRHSLPGVHCRTCGETWSTVGLQYPEVEVPAGLDAARYVPWPVEIEEFEQLRDGIRRRFPRDAILRPGTAFGPLEGTARNLPESDFVWQNPWTPLVTEQAFSALQAELRCLAGVPVLLDWPSPLLELSIHVGARLAGDDIRRVCSRCDRRAGHMRKNFAVVGKKRGLALFRLEQAPAVIVATAAFVDAVEALDLAGLAFEEI